MSDPSDEPSASADRTSSDGDCWRLPGELAGIAGRLIDTLSGRGETLATAESLTGGLIGATITSIAGASTVYRGGVISYATELKSELARVENSTLAAHGAVSEPTAAAMARGIAIRCGADWGIAATGVAGPAGQEGHPPGTVYCAVAWHPDALAGGAAARSGWDSGSEAMDGCWIQRCNLGGDRAQIRSATVTAVLELTTWVCRR